MDPDGLLKSLADIADSNGGRVTLFIAAALAIPTTVIAMWRWATGWLRARQRRNAINFLAECMDRAPVMSKKLEDGDDPLVRAEGTKMLADAVEKTEQHISLPQGKTLRSAASLPATGEITSAETEYPLAGYETKPVHWHVQQRIGRTVGRIETMFSEGTI